MVQLDWNSVSLEVLLSDRQQFPLTMADGCYVGQTVDGFQLVGGFCAEAEAVTHVCLRSFGLTNFPKPLPGPNSDEAPKAEQSPASAGFSSSCCCT